MGCKGVYIARKYLHDVTFQNSYLFSLQLKLCRVAAVKILLVHHHSADYIVFSFGIIGFILCDLENIILLKPTLGGVVSVDHFIASHE